jgi:hypothetical protein
VLLFLKASYGEPIEAIVSYIFPDNKNSNNINNNKDVTEFQLYNGVAMPVMGLGCCVVVFVVVSFIDILFI